MSMTNSSALVDILPSNVGTDGVILGSVGVGLGAISFLYIVAKAAITKYITTKFSGCTPSFFSIFFKEALKTNTHDPSMKELEEGQMATFQINAKDLETVQQMLKLLKTSQSQTTTPPPVAVTDE
jgi:restriction endonuclease S subunit